MMLASVCGISCCRGVIYPVCLPSPGHTYTGTSALAHRLGSKFIVFPAAGVWSTQCACPVLATPTPAPAPCSQAGAAHPSPRWTKKSVHRHNMKSGAGHVLELLTSCQHQRATFLGPSRPSVIAIIPPPLFLLNNKLFKTVLNLLFKDRIDPY